MSRMTPMMRMVTKETMVKMSQCIRGISRFSLAAIALLIVVGLGLAGCGVTTTVVQAGGSTSAPTATTVPVPTATLAAVTCGSQYGSAYQATLPNATYSQTTVFSA